MSEDKNVSKRDEDRDIAIFCPSHKGVFMAKLSEIEGKEEVVCKVCGAKLAFTVKDPYANLNLKTFNMLDELMEAMINVLESQLDRFFGFFNEDWYRRRKTFRR